MDRFVIKRPRETEETTRILKMSKCLPPLEPSGFSILDRDLTHLVFRHLEVPFLCLLKCVSHSVANACRRTLRSYELYEGPFASVSSYDHMSECIYSSSFTLPVKVSVMIFGSIQSVTDLYEDTKKLIVHEFNLEFYWRNERVTNPSQVIKWFYKAWEDMHDDWDAYDGPPTSHEEDMEVRCTKLTVEQPGVGIFHSVASLWRHLDFEDVLKSGVGDQFSASWSISSSPKHLPLELFMRLWPYAELDTNLSFAFDDAQDSGPCKTDMSIQGSLLFCYLKERIVGTPFNRV